MLLKTKHFILGNIIILFIKNNYKIKRTEIK